MAGIFEVAGVTQARIFVNRPSEFHVYPVKCYQDTVGTMSLPWYILPPGTFVTQDPETVAGILRGSVIDNATGSGVPSAGLGVTILGDNRFQATKTSPTGR